MGIRKSYLDAKVGQIHVRSLDAGGAGSRPPLICLHPAPYSGDYFATAMPLLNDGRRVVAPDYPGYGGSCRLDEPPSISNYANAVIDSVLAAEAGGQVDLLGFHSGCLVAAEISLLATDRVRRLVLIDVPYFDAETQKQFYPRVANPLELTRELECLTKAWDFNVASRKDVVPLARAFDMFVDQLRSGTRDHYCFHAAFTYDCVARFAEVSVPTTVIATQSPLLAATRAAGAALPHAVFSEIDSITTSVFEQGAAIIAREITKALADA